MNPIRILLVDDQVTARSALSDLLTLEPDLKVVGVADDGVVGVERAVELRPDVVLMDVMMPGISGIDATAQVVQRSPGVRVIVFSTSGRTEDVLAALAAGATTYLLKDIGRADLVAAIRAAAAVGAEPEPLPELTDGEVEVLKLFARGLDDDAIASALTATAALVNHRMNSICAKFGVEGRRAAVVAAVMHGIVTGS